MGGAMNNAGVFIIDTAFYLYISVLVLRVLLQYFRANPANPICHLVGKLTNPLVLPVKNYIPNYKTISLATLLILFILEFIKINLLVLVAMGKIPNQIGVLFWGLGDILNLVINIFFYGIFLYVLLSWLGPKGSNPLAEVLFYLTQPLLGPARRFIPLIAGIDLSPIPVMIGLQIVSILLFNPLVSFGVRLALKSFLPSVAVSM